MKNKSRQKGTRKKPGLLAITILTTVLSFILLLITLLFYLSPVAIGLFGILIFILVAVIAALSVCTLFLIWFSEDFKAFFEGLTNYGEKVFAFAETSSNFLVPYVPFIAVPGLVFSLIGLILSIVGTAKTSKGYISTLILNIIFVLINIIYIVVWVILTIKGVALLPFTEA